MDQPHIEPPQGGKGEEQETRERILAAASQLMAKKGYKGATTRKISELAGVNEVTIFRHFKNKETILEELLKGILNIRQQLENHLHGEYSELREMLRRYAHGYYGMLVERKEILMICMIEADNHPEVIKLFSSVPVTAVEVLCSKLQEFQDQGHLPKKDSFTAALMFVSTFFYAFMAKHRINLALDLDEEQLVENACDILINGITDKQN
ncbi:MULTISPECIES: TetR/AcrR family transcriptional regulator [Brevibacillus]|jgi:AcrR family transcriptional regulator|uniref:TetR/AcrR family transcriptional regulator n=1 Tax=Brevibacillus TaxID=55080 RepID=UPI00285ECEE2|nr:TetR/AcrR family transcriptional regulator [Brevibacillus nitrificans]MDR7315223.1 AcrR family transcriptional regulator [Brevibacillus nitrificans]